MPGNHGQGRTRRRRCVGGHRVRARAGAGQGGFARAAGAPAATSVRPARERVVPRGGVRARGHALDRAGRRRAPAPAAAGAWRRRRRQPRLPACGARDPSTSERVGERARHTRRRRGPRRTQGGGRSTRDTSPRAMRSERRSGRRAVGQGARGRRGRPHTAAHRRRRMRRTAGAGSDRGVSRHTSLTSRCLVDATQLRGREPDPGRTREPDPGRTRARPRPVVSPSVGRVIDGRSQNGGRQGSHSTSVETKPSRVSDVSVTNVCRYQRDGANARSASASVSLEPTSYHRPGTRQAYTGTRG